MSSSRIIHEIRSKIREGAIFHSEIVSNSMLPLFQAGDRCKISYKSISDLKVDDIIAYERNENIVAHKLIRIDPHHLITKGESSTECDPPVSHSYYIGSVTGRYNKPHRYKFHLLFGKKFLGFVLQFKRAVLDLCLWILFSLKSLKFIKIGWRHYITLLMWITKDRFTSENIAHLHFHSRYRLKETVAGSSDLDFTVVLKSFSSISLRNRIYNSTNQLAHRMSKWLPCFDLPYVFFLDELPDIISTSVFMKRSMLMDHNIAHRINSSSIVDDNKDYIHFGILDELFSISKRVLKLNNTKHVFPSLVKKKVQFEYSKIIADIRYLKCVAESLTTNTPYITVNSRDELFEGYPDKLEVNQEILKLIHILPHNLLEEPKQPIDLDLDELVFNILSFFKGINPLDRPKTLHISQFLRASGLQF